MMWAKTKEARFSQCRLDLRRVKFNACLKTLLSSSGIWQSKALPLKAFSLHFYNLPAGRSRKGCLMDCVVGQC